MTCHCFDNPFWQSVPKVGLGGDMLVMTGVESSSRCYFVKPSEGQLPFDGTTVALGSTCILFFSCYV